MMPKEYIKRDLAMQCVYQYLMEQTVSKYATYELCLATRAGISMALEVLDDVPAADVAPVVHGEWIVNPKREYDYICSVCGGDAPEDRWRNNAILTPFCPHCGAKMDGGKE
jgi:hypothetical protein